MLGKLPDRYICVRGCRGSAGREISARGATGKPATRLAQSVCLRVRIVDYFLRTRLLYAIFYGDYLLCHNAVLRQHHHGAGPIPLQIAIPNRMRGRAISLLVFMTNLLGGGIGPFLVGYLSQKFHGIDNALGLGLAIVSVSAATAATLFYTLAMKRSATAVSHD